jgi:hypothetical protein
MAARVEGIRQSVCGAVSGTGHLARPVTPSSMRVAGGSRPSRRPGAVAEAATPMALRAWVVRLSRRSGRRAAAPSPAPPRPRALAPAPPGSRRQRPVSARSAAEGARPVGRPARLPARRSRARPCRHCPPPGSAPSSWARQPRPRGGAAGPRGAASGPRTGKGPAELRRGVLRSGGAARRQAEVAAVARAGRTASRSRSSGRGREPRAARARAARRVGAGAAGGAAAGTARSAAAGSPCSV